ncbi:helix-turn-helix domain-containing protein [Halorubellus sp. PRR65]|uniref:TrmB family transcriptional regulator n=1 Tax=Halorubellus sp. PRR65 TaxID=3098148 RepID=UPI002B25F05E|nr:helix-turn-helix domain-containing protein [Halorubellus sp. PRR65]
MTEYGTVDAVPETESLLEALGFTEYEAKCFVAATRVGTGTAKEVSEVADVPRARVYDCMESLAERGLVDVQEANPKKYRAVRPETAVATLQRAFEDRFDRLNELLPELHATARESEDGDDVWVIEGGADVAERMVALIEDADESVVVAIGAEGLLSAELLASLVAANERGVSVTVGSPGEPIRDRVVDSLPDASVQETWTWWKSFPIRPGAVSSVLLVDGRALLVSSDDPSSLPGREGHRAVWTDGANTPLVGLLRPLLERAVRGEAQTTGEPSPV